MDKERQIETTDWLIKGYSEERLARMKVEAIKEAEYGDETIIRLYDCKNARTKVTVSFGFDVSEVYLGNLSEKKLKKLTVKNNKVSLEIKPFEIVTLIVK